MKTHEFFNKYCGRKIDFDGAFGAQCVDLFRQYCKDVMNIPERMEGVEGAKDLWLNYDKMPIEKKYLKKEQADYGDVVVFDRTATNPYGHVAIFVGFTNSAKSEMLVFEQDGFEQGGAKFAKRGAENVLGYFWRKNS